MKVCRQSVCCWSRKTLEIKCSISGFIFGKCDDVAQVSVPHLQREQFCFLRQLFVCSPAPDPNQCVSEQRMGVFAITIIISNAGGCETKSQEKQNPRIKSVFVRRGFRLPYCYPADFSAASSCYFQCNQRRLLLLLLWTWHCYYSLLSTELMMVQLFFFPTPWHGSACDHGNQWKYSAAHDTWGGFFFLFFFLAARV